MLERHPIMARGLEIGAGAAVAVIAGKAIKDRLGKPHVAQKPETDPILNSRECGDFQRIPFDSDPRYNT